MSRSCSCFGFSYLRHEASSVITAYVFWFNEEFILVKTVQVQNYEICMIFTVRFFSVILLIPKLKTSFLKQLTLILVFLTINLLPQTQLFSFSYMITLTGTDITIPHKQFEGYFKKLALSIYRIQFIGVTMCSQTTAYFGHQSLCVTQ